MRDKSNERISQLLCIYVSFVGYTDFWSPADYDHTNLHFLHIIKKNSTLAFQINFKILVWRSIGHI